MARTLLRAALAARLKTSGTDSKPWTTGTMGDDGGLKSLEVCSCEAAVDADDAAVGATVQITCDRCASRVGLGGMPWLIELTACVGVMARPGPS